MIRLFRSIALAAALGAPSLALAAPPEASPVTALDAGIIATMKSGSAGASFQSRYATMDKVVSASFNLPEITQNSVGFLWATLPAAQQQALEQVFEQFTVASYVSEFSTFQGEHFTLAPTEKDLGAKKIVETQLVPGDGSAPTELDYVVENGPAGWQITDVLLGGTISQVAVHASDFSSLVTSGDATPLINALKSKVAALSGAN